jgi:hypothetical protein
VMQRAVDAIAATLDVMGVRDRTPLPA